MREPQPHQPVLYNEIIHALQPRRAGRYVDCTVGAGGHARGILEASQPDGLLLGIDLDPVALQIAGARLNLFRERVHLIQASYTTLRAQLQVLGWETVDGILIDLGVSSMQLDTPERGFSFLKEADLDMRFSPSIPMSAMDLVNMLPEEELADIIYRFGEERRSRRIAQAIIRARPVHTTTQLAQLVAQSTSSGKPGRHPATRTFQALRIAVNRELDALQEGLPQAVASLGVGGRLAVIAYHSLEDRIVKQYFRKESTDCICPPRQPICTCGHKATIKEVNRKPIRPSVEETQSNPRARSARLRLVEKLGPR
jgi:16S rRNA (cytosine1402-N4)-methyltransferase